MPAPVSHHVDSATGIFLWQNLVITISADSAQVSHMRAIEQAYRKLLARHPKGVCGLVLIAPGATLPTKEVRHEAGRFMRELDKSLVQTAIVIEDTGAIAQLFVTVVRGINLLAGNATSRVCASLEDAGALLAPVITRLTGTSTSAAEVIAAAREARSSMPSGERRAAY